MFKFVKKDTSIGFGSPAWDALLGNSKGDLIKDKSFESYVRNALKGNPVVAASLGFIIMNLYNLPVLLVRTDKDDELITIKDHPILDLIRKPNQYQTGKDFWSLHYQYLYANGDVLVKKQLVNGKAGSMIQFKPGTYDVKVGAEYITDQSSSLVQYTSITLGQVIPYDEAYLRKFVDPEDEYAGLGKGCSPLEPIASYITLNNKYVAYNNEVLDNSAKPSGVFTIGKQIDKSAMDRTKIEIEQMYASTSNAGKIAVLQGPDGKFTQFEDRSDATWIRGFQMTAQKIATALGLDPGLVGEVASKTYSNFKEAIKKVYNDVIVPLKEEELDFLNQFIVEDYNNSDKKENSLKLVIDYKNIEVLQKELTELINALNGVSYLTEKQKQEAVGYEGDENRDVYVLKVGDREVNKDRTPSITDVEPKEEPPAETEEEKMIRVKQIKKKVLATEVFESIDTLRNQYIADLENKLVDYFDQQAKRISEQLIITDEKSYTTKEAISVDLVELVDGVDWEKEVSILNTTVYDNASEAYLASSKEIARLFNFSSESVAISASKIKEEVLQRSVFITETTRKRVTDILATAIEEGTSIQNTAINIQSVIDEQKLSRSATIANTEIGSAVSNGIFETYSNENIEEHEWVTAGDGSVRKTHSNQDGFIVQIGETFPNGLKYPSEYGGPPEEVIDCRCITLPIIE